MKVKEVGFKLRLHKCTPVMSVNFFFRSVSLRDKRKNGSGLLPLPGLWAGLNITPQNQGNITELQHNTHVQDTPRSIHTCTGQIYILQITVFKSNCLT